MTKDQGLVQQMFALVKKWPAVNHQENMLLLRAAKRLDELTRARAMRWGDAVRRAYYSQPAYVTGYMEGCLENDSSAVLYSPHMDLKEDIYAVVNKDTMWTIHPDDPGVILWSMVPTAEQIAQEEARRREAAANTTV